MDFLLKYFIFNIAKQYNELPFYVKAIKLLANEYQRSLQEEDSYVEGYEEVNF